MFVWQPAIYRQYQMAYHSLILMAVGLPAAGADNDNEPDMPGKADVIVTEIFDSELLGEGLLPTLRHAVPNLLKVVFISYTTLEAPIMCIVLGSTTSFVRSFRIQPLCIRCGNAKFYHNYIYFEFLDPSNST
eukprot:scaffold108218_cov16-Prasinocladus_malaysianus.AAC.1